MSDLQKEKDETLRITLHERAREASVEQRKLLISLSTAGLGAYFVALTVKVDPPLLQTQQWTLCGGALLLFVSTVVGIFAWQADAQRNYFWARGLSATTDEKRKPFITTKNKWTLRLELSMRMLRYSFAGGILAGVAYSILRIFNI